MSTNDSMWLCTLCEKAFEVDPGTPTDEIRCPHCMRRTGLVPGGESGPASPAKMSEGGAEARATKGGSGLWKLLVLVVALGLGAGGAWWAWTAFSKPGPLDGLEQLAKTPDLASILDVGPEDSRLASCNSLKGFEDLLNSAGLVGDAGDAAPGSLRSVETLLAGSTWVLPAEGLAIGLSCLRKNGAFAAVCRPATKSLTMPIEKQPVGLCVVRDGTVTDAVLLPHNTALELSQLEPLEPAKGAAWVLAAAGGLAREPSDTYRLLGAALDIWEDPVIRFQLGEAKVRYKVMDFASEDMAKALMAGYNEEGVLRLAELQMRLGRFAEALGMYQKALQEGSTSPVVKLGKARCLLSVGKPDEAGPLLTELSKQSPDLEGLNQVLAAWHMMGKRPDEALAALKTDLAAHPSPGAALALVRATESMKGSEPAYQALAEIKVQGVELELERLRLGLMTGKKAETLELAKTLATRYGEDANVQRACGLVFFDMNDLPRSETSFAAAERLGGGKEFESLTYLTLVRYLLESKGQKPSPSGEETFKMLVGRHPNARLDVALSLEGLGLWQKARELLESALAADAGKMDLAVALYGLYLRNGDPGKADQLRQATLKRLSEAERPGVEEGFQHELESVQHPETTPSANEVVTPPTKAAIPSNQAPAPAAPGTPAPASK